MIKLEIRVIPKDIKRVEFSQSLTSLRDDLQRCCPNLEINEESETFCLNAELKSEDQLNEVLDSKEFCILSGAIRTLGEKSEIIIEGINYKKRVTDLSEIRLKYLKTKKVKTITQF